jgi:NitT/TauT family transport system permease protein
MRRRLPPLLVLAGGLACWEGAVPALRVPAWLLPAPHQVMQAAVGHAPALLAATAWTAAAAAGGFLLSMSLGLLIALLFSQSETLRRGCYPYAIFLQTVPIVAIAPLIVIWFGTGMGSIVLVSFIISLFPVITNGTAGLLRVDPALLDLFRLYRATRLQVLLRLRLPHAVPFLVAAARISSGLSVIGAIVGEFFAGYGAGRQGLGYLITLTSGQLKTEYLFACVLASAGLGLVIFWSVGVAGNTVLRKWQEQER